MVTILYHTKLSPLCRELRLILFEKGIEFHLVDDDHYIDKILNDYQDQNQQSALWQPFLTVPMLQMDYTVLTEVQAIRELLVDIETTPPPMQEAQSTKSEQAWLSALTTALHVHTDTPANMVLLPPNNTKMRFQTRQLIAWLDDTFYHHVTGALLYEKIHKKTQQLGYQTPDSHIVNTALQHLKSHLTHISALLENHSWLMGEHMTLADLTLGAHISCLDYLGVMDWKYDGFADLRNWYSVIKSRPSFRGLLSEQIPGFPPPDHYGYLDF